MQKKSYFYGSLIVLAVVSGCSSTPYNLALSEAHNQYNNARTDPQITNMAALELQEASKYLDKADHALKAQENDSKVNHLAYLASQQVAIAQETAKAKVAESAVTDASAKRDQVLLEARTAEAEEAKQQVAFDQLLIARQQKELEELNAKKTERGLVVTLDDVLFRTDMAQLQPGGIRTVQKVANFLRQYEQKRVLIEGHTDSTGSHNYNQELSDRRANAVRMALIDSGISSHRIDARGYGEDFPVAGNETSAGRQLNRRVEIIFSDDDGKIIQR